MNSPLPMQPLPHAAPLTGRIAVDTEAVAAGGADGLHGLHVALAAQPRLQHNAGDTSVTQGQLPTTCPLLCTPGACWHQGAAGTSLQLAAVGTCASLSLCHRFCCRERSSEDKGPEWTSICRSGGQWAGRGVKKVRAAQGGSIELRIQLWWDAKSSAFSPGGKQRAQDPALVRCRELRIQPCWLIESSMELDLDYGEDRELREVAEIVERSSVPQIGFNPDQEQRHGDTTIQPVWRGEPGTGVDTESRCQRGGSKAGLG